MKKLFAVIKPPKVLSSDNGGEFKGVVAQYLKDNNIIQKMNEVGDHNVLGIVDRFSQTVKNKIYKFLLTPNLLTGFRDFLILWKNIMTALIQH